VLHSAEEVDGAPEGGGTTPDTVMGYLTAAQVDQVVDRDVSTS